MNKKDEQFFIVQAHGESITISAEVLSSVAAISARDTEGVAGVNGTLKGSVMGLVGLRKTGDGVRVEQGEKGLVLTVSITVSYGYSAPQVAAKVQEAIISAVEDMTGVTLSAVNVRVTDVDFSNAKDNK